jgi:hypothetical protein
MQFCQSQSLMRLLPILLLCLLPPCQAASPCDAEGGFGIRFGSPPPPDARLVEGGKASRWHQVGAPEADARFDRYRIRSDSASDEVFEVQAIKTITPAPARSEPPITEPARQAGQARAADFARDYIAQLPESLRDRLVQDRHGGARWSAKVVDGVQLTISANFAWDVTVACKDLRREWALARRVLPELFEGGKR